MDNRKSSHSWKRQRLVELMQRINFGIIGQLVIRDGQPVFDPPPQILQKVKFGGGENGPRPEIASADFPLKLEIIELFQRFDEMGNGVVEFLFVKHGLPSLMTVEIDA